MRKLLIALLLVIITAKIAGVLARGPVPIERDAFGYWKLSALVMGGDILMLADPIAYRTPGYPWFLALVRLIGGPTALIAVVAIQGFLGVMSCLIAGRIAARITKLPRAMPWTLAVLIPPVSAYTFSAAVLSESLFVFLFMVHLLAVMDYAQRATPGRAVFLGITFALALLVRPIIVLLWVPHILFLLHVHFRKLRRLGRKSPNRAKLHHRVGHAILAALVIGIMISPWLMRNQSLFGKPLLTEFVGRNLWVVTFQDGSGAGLSLPDSSAGRDLQRRLQTVGAGEDWQATWSVSNALMKSGLDDAQADQLMRRVSIDAIELNQETFAWKAFRRVVNFWRCAATDLPDQYSDGDNFHGQQTWGWEVPPIEMALEYRWSKSVMLNTILAAALLVSLLFLMTQSTTRPYAIWFLLIFAYFSLVTGILEIPAYRYRIVLEPLMAAIFGSAIAVMVSRRRKLATVDA